MLEIWLFQERKKISFLKKITKLFPNLFLKYLKIGTLNTLFGFTLFSLLSFSKIDTWLVLFLSQVGGILFNFCTFGSFVFNSLDINKLPKFILSNLIIYIMFLGSLYILEGFVSNRIFALSIAVIPITIINFFILSKLIFNTNK